MSVNFADVTEYERFVIYTQEAEETEPWPWSGSIERQDDAETEIARLRVEYPHKTWHLLRRSVKETWL